MTFSLVLKFMVRPCPRKNAIHEEYFVVA